MHSNLQTNAAKAPLEKVFTGLPQPGMRPNEPCLVELLLHCHQPSRWIGNMTNIESFRHFMMEYFSTSQHCYEHCG